MLKHPPTLSGNHLSVKSHSGIGLGKKANDGAGNRKL